MRRWAGFVVLAAFLPGLTPTTRGWGAPVPEADAFAHLQGVTLEGKTVRIADWKGRYLLVEFFATWCRPCMAQLPQIAALHNRYGGDSLAFLGVSLDYDPAQLRVAVERSGIAFPVIGSGLGPADPMVRAFGVDRIPASWLIAPDGTATGLRLTPQRLEKVLEAIHSGNSEQIERKLKEYRLQMQTSDRILHLLSTGRIEDASSAATELARIHPDSEIAGELVRLAASAAGGNPRKGARPEYLRPPNNELPSGVILPGASPGEPHYRSVAEMRLVSRALEEFGEANGYYPVALDVLSRRGEYLPEIPPDPHGTALRYRTDGSREWDLIANGPDGDADATADWKTDGERPGYHPDAGTGDGDVIVRRREDTE